MNKYMISIDNSKTQYYIIRADEDKISDQQKALETHMIKNFSYNELKWDDKTSYRKNLIERIDSYGNWISSFCAVNHFTGMDTTLSLTNYIYNTSNTIIYSIEKKKIRGINKTILDCVLLFREKIYENKPYIDVISFCANQIIPIKKGGIFFDHFLNSLRGQYTQVELSSAPEAYDFYLSFHFEDMGQKNMVRTISPKSNNNRTRKSPGRKSSSRKSSSRKSSSRKSSSRKSSSRKSSSRKSSSPSKK